MIEKFIDGIDCLLDEDNLTAECYGGIDCGDIVIPKIVVFENVPYCVTSIGLNAFAGCEFLTSVVIPDSVKSIGPEAFCRCNSLTKITIPDSVTSIGAGAFGLCNSLEKKPTQEIGIDRLTYRLLLHNHLAMVIGCSGCSEIVIIDIPSEITHEGINYRVTTIGKEAFFLCISLTNITIPNSVTSIELSAFCHCSSLTDITIPDSVTCIGKRAFKDCTSLTSITYQGTIAQWKKIELGDGWNNDIPATVVHCTDGDVEI